MAYINGNKILSVVQVIGSGGGTGIPTLAAVSNLTINSITYLASWTAPDMTDFSDYTYTLTYIVEVNGTQITETANTSINIGSYLVTGANTVSVTAKVELSATENSDASSETITYSPPSYEITTLSTTLPAATSDMPAGVVGTNVYIFGGLSTNANRLNTINKFDTTTETITTLSATLPAEISQMAAGVVGTNIYIFGGYTSAGSRTNTIYKFDTTTETITTLSATLPAATSDMPAGVVGTNVYIFGGRVSSTVNTIYKFDTTTETITTLSATLKLRNMPAGVVGTNIYIFGGLYSYSHSNTIYKFDTTTETITTLSATLPAAITGMPAGSIETNIYIFGGYNGNYFRTIYKFTVD